jgi:hypothetical protein
LAIESVGEQPAGALPSYAYVTAGSPFEYVFFRMRFRASIGRSEGL